MTEPLGYFVNGHEPETRVTDPTTGSEKGQKLAQIGAMDAKALYTVAEVAGYGANKYSYNNWVGGYLYSLSYDALQRHLMKFWAGEDYDPESGHHHMAHAAWHCLALLGFQLRGTGTDNRPGQEHAPTDSGEPDMNKNATPFLISDSFNLRPLGGFDKSVQ